jgi:hypothetical protein
VRCSATLQQPSRGIYRSPLMTRDTDQSTASFEKRRLSQFGTPFAF